MSGQPDGLSAYPLDLSPLLASAHGERDEQGISAEMPERSLPNPGEPTIEASQALIEWNAYLATGNEQHREAFLSQAAWLLEHATVFAEKLAGWPVLTHLAALAEPLPLLSASTQG